MTTAEGVVTETVYDQAGQVRSTTLDPQSVQNPDGLTQRTEYAYDARGLILTLTEASGTPEALVTTFRYDSQGHVTQKVVDPSGLAHTTVYGYDDNGRLRLEPGPDGVATFYGYDVDGNRTDVVRAYGAADAQHTHYAYDANHRLVAVTDAIGNGLAERNDAEYQARRIALGYPAEQAQLTSAQQDELRARYAPPPTCSPTSRPVIRSRRSSGSIECATPSGPSNPSACSSRCPTTPRSSVGATRRSWTSSIHW